MTFSAVLMVFMGGNPPGGVMFNFMPALASAGVIVRWAVRRIGALH